MYSLTKTTGSIAHNIACFNNLILVNNPTLIEVTFYLFPSAVVITDRVNGI